LTFQAGFVADSNQTGVGERYAVALFELAEQANQIDAVERDLQQLRALLAESRDLRRLLSSPGFTADDQARGLNAVAERAGFTPLTRKLLGLLAANRRAAAAQPTADAYIRMARARRGVVGAEVTTAAPLTDVQAEGVRAALRQALGKDPEITTRVDPRILGGLRVKVGSRLFDASLKSRLDQLKFALQRA
jgi:F-type H+-transporting ATPase subunit delta